MGKSKGWEAGDAAGGRRVADVELRFAEIAYGVARILLNLTFASLIAGSMPLPKMAS